jgi:hypothetical protein
VSDDKTASIALETPRVCNSYSRRVARSEDDVRSCASGGLESAHRECSPSRSVYPDADRVLQVERITCSSSLLPPAALSGSFWRTTVSVWPMPPPDGRSGDEEHRIQSLQGVILRQDRPRMIPLQ